MNSCSENRKRIAWMATGALGAAEASQTRAHLETCQGCRRYSEEILRVTALLSVEPESNIRTSQVFHERVMVALRNERKPSVWESVAGWVRDGVGKSRVALPLAAAAAVVAVALLVSGGRGYRAFPPKIQIEDSSIPGFKTDLEPTLSHYQAVANQSLEKFDELLSAQANKNLSTGPIFSTSPLARPEVLD
jgi:anti-sigma factor RsiW